MDIEEMIDKVLENYDELAYINNGSLLCVLCARNSERLYPVFPSVKFERKQYCSRCDSELVVNVINWECDDCGTLNDHSLNECDGCTNKKE